MFSNRSQYKKWKKCCPFGHSDPRVEFFNNNASTWDTSGPDPTKTLKRLTELESMLKLTPGMNLIEVGWEKLLSETSLSIADFTDQPDLFFLRAVKK
jgi:hypothetical protein